MISTEFPQSWYPICLSSEVSLGRVIAVQGLGTVWAVCRFDDGRVGVLHHRCSHSGADLCRGRVTGHCLQCPLHHWEFDGAGACRRIPGADSIPEKTGQFALPVEEHFGMVFAFLGDAPLFPFPVSNESGTYRRGPIYQDTFPVPYPMVGFNSFDEGHLGPVHARELIGVPTIEVRSQFEIGMEYRARVAGRRLRDRLVRRIGLSDVHMAIHSFGGTLVVFHHRKIDAFTLLALMPLEENRIRLYVFSSVRKQRHAAMDYVRVQVLHRIVLNFMQEDFDVLRGIVFLPQGLTSPHDDTMIAWYRHFNRLPVLDLAQYQNGSMTRVPDKIVVDA